MKTTIAERESYTIWRPDCPEKNRPAARGSEPAYGCSRLLLKNVGKSVPVLPQKPKLCARGIVTSESPALTHRRNNNTLQEKRYSGPYRAVMA
jgi:hypothetical protein